ncbi:MAG TPA: 5-oxoprolinase subunit PxpB [Candidatus Limnocylindrales bacterium]|nr:5-oxoprolinase subunit PxpB [Candidatus Limnocylindrales bacterium]
MDPRILPFGDAAVLVEVGETASIGNARRARILAAALDRLRDTDPRLGVPVPAAASVLVPFDPRTMDPAEAEALIARSLPALGAPDAGSGAPVKEHVIRVRYGGADGPDLEAVAAEVGRSPADVVALHAGTAYEVLFLGFAPGFAYLGELAADLVVPRLASPRVRVPAGSVAIAGTMTAVYPRASAGGWRLLGRTEAALFDPAMSPPARLRPGDRVRFEPA